MISRQTLRRIETCAWVCQRAPSTERHVLAFRNDGPTNKTRYSDSDRIINYGQSVSRKVLRINDAASLLLDGRTNRQLTKERMDEWTMDKQMMVDRRTTDELTTDDARADGRCTNDVRMDRIYVKNPPVILRDASSMKLGGRTDQPSFTATSEDEEGSRCGKKNPGKKPG